MIKLKKVAVMAGTKVDTQMGGDFLNEKIQDTETILCPVSETPQEQTLFQISREKEKIIGEIIDSAKANGAEAIFVYCNSLSGAIDFEKLSEEKKIRTITPLSIYRKIGKKYGRIGVLAANNQSLAKIEENILLGNPDAVVLGCAVLPAVIAIEEKITPERIVEQTRLESLISFFEANGAEAIILGCTHFPYLKNVLKSVAKVPLIDPAEDMLRELLDE